MHWKNICISQDKSILDAIGIIDQGVCQTVLVTDASTKLLGVVSDGDVRRAILQGHDLQTPVAQIMNTQPVTVSVAEGYGTALVRLRSLGVRYIPVLDDAGRVVDFWSVEQLLRFNALSNPVVIMAGGLGTRLAPLTEDAPKPMLPVGGRPLLEHIVQHFVSMGFRQFYFTVNYKAGHIKEYFADGAAFGVSIDYVHETKRLGTAGALALLPERPTLPTIVMNGDILTRLDFAAVLAQHLNRAALATMVVKQHAIQIPYGVVSADRNNALLGIDEKPQHTFLISTGINVLSPEAFNYIPHEQFFDMPELFTALVQAQKPTHIHEMQEYWLDIGRLADYRRANEEFDLYSQYGL